MQASDIRRLALGLGIIFVVVVVVAGCGPAANNPYSGLKNPPLAQGRLMTVTLASDSPSVAEAIAAAGFVEATLPPNYQQADAVEASLWNVPEPVAVKARLFTAPTQGAADLRLLTMPLAARGRTAEVGTDRAFFRNVLGVDVPKWPLPGSPDDNTRVQVWSYQIPSVVDASKRMRENGIPVVFDPVSITTSYLGTYKTLAIRAPDGTVVQLVETASE